MSSENESEPKSYYKVNIKELEEGLQKFQPKKQQETLKVPKIKLKKLDSDTIHELSGKRKKKTQRLS